MRMPLAIAACGMALLAGCNNAPAPTGDHAAGSSATAVPTPTPLKASFSGASTRLKHTQFPAALESAVAIRHNAVWCAAFGGAWQQMRKLGGGGPLQISQFPDDAAIQNLDKQVGAAKYMPGSNRNVVAQLNAERQALPPGESYSAAGLIERGIFEKITADMRRLYPKRPAPSFPPVSQGVMAYAYLQTKLSFPMPYLDTDKPLTFTAGDGQRTRVGAFGVNEDGKGPRHQVEVLYVKGEPPHDEFVLDLSKYSHPNQIVVALVPRPESSLRSCYDSVQRKITQRAEHVRPGERELDEKSKLRVPAMVWNVLHHFTELEGRHITAGPLKGQRLDLAQQDLDFRLDRRGVEVKAEAMFGASGAEMASTLKKPRDYIIDRPFLLYLKRRDAPEPFFVMWVDNAELLQRM